MKKKALISIISSVLSLVVIAVTAVGISVATAKTEYNVAFNTFGGTAIETQIIEEGDVAVKPSDPIKTGYIFDYWENGGVKYDFSTAVNSDITLDAVYKISDYTVTFINFDEIASVEGVNYNEKVSSVKLDPMDGYTFMYWMLDGEQYIFDTPITKDITLVANWQETALIEQFYVVTFDTGDDSSVSIMTAENSVVTKIDDPTREHEYFVKWIYEDKEFNFDTLITNDITLTAVWEDITYTITFNADGGSSVGFQVILSTEKITKPDDPTKDGFIFMHWTYNGNEYDFDSTVVCDMTLVAKWVDRLTYAVVFDSGSGTSTVYVYENEKVAKPSNPTREHEVFVKWMLGDEEYDFDSPVTETITLTALWEDKTFTINFNTGTGGSIVDSVVILSTQTITMPETPTREGYDFLYWTYGDSIYYFGSTVTNNMTLVANWKLITPETVYYTISFNAASGSAVDQQVVVEGGMVIQPSTTRENYNFVCWTYNSVEYNFYTPVTSNMTLVAKWEIYNFTITFDTDGGSYVAPQQVDLYSRVSSQMTLKTDYNFLYWADEQGKEYNFSTLVTGAFTLTAVWEKIIRFEVSYDSVGGSAVDSQLVISGYSASVPYNPTKDDYTFVYWMLDGVQYNFATAVTQDIELVAFWTSVQDNVITFNTDGGSYVASVVVPSYGYVTAPSPEPTKEDYLFMYWELDGEQYNFGTQVMGSFELTAKWYYNYQPEIIYHTVTFVSNGSVYATKTVQDGYVVATSSMSNTTTHRFDNWYLGNDTMYDFTMLVTSDLTLYAYWNERIYHTIEYDFDGGTLSNTNYLAKVGEEGYTVSHSSTSSTYIYPTKALHSFSYWKAEDGTTFVFGTTIVTGPLKLTAVYTEVPLELTFTDYTVSFYGGSRTRTVSGTIPNGVTITYENNSHVNAGVYIAYAYAWYEGEIIQTYSCTITITAINLTLTISVEKLYEYTGEIITPVVTISSSGFSSSDYNRGSYYVEYNGVLKNVGTYTGTALLKRTINDELVINTNYNLINNTFILEITQARAYNFDYTTSDTNEITITGLYNSLQADLTVPSHINNVPVTSISNSAFYGYTSLLSVSLPDTITEIGYRTFRGCTNLASVSLGSNTTIIGQEAFYGCTSLTYIDIPDKVVTIGTSAFYGCTSLTSLTIPNSVTSIESSAFYNCNKVTSINFGSGLITIGTSAFASLTSLTSLVLPNKLETIGSSAFSTCTALTSVEFPESLLTIGDYAFYRCQRVASLDFSEGLETIGARAFYCYSSAYYNYALTELNLPNSITSIGTYAFSQLRVLESVNIPSNLVTLNTYVFYCNVKLATVTFPSNTKLTSISACAFQYNYFASISIPTTVTTIGNYAFANNSALTSITIPNSVMSLGTYLFQSCTALTSYTLPSQITTLPNYMFYLCTGLNTINIPSTVVTIGTYVFSGCTNVTSIVLGSSNTITSIGGYAFQNISLIDSFVIPITTTSIGTYAFAGWLSLKSITIPASTTSLGNYAFQNCTSLTSFVVPSTVTSMGTYLFSGCTSLTIVTINAQITALPDGTFHNCKSLVTYVLPAGITQFGTYSFYYCESLTSITIPTTVTSIGYSSFQYCTGLSSIRIPINVTTMTTYSSYYKYNYAQFRYMSADFKIFVEAEEQPSGWSSYWNYYGYTVMWGV